MDTSRAIAWNTGVQAVGKIVSTVLGVAIVALMTRYLGKEGFGYYATANAFFQIFALMLDLGINVMIVQMLGERKGDAAFENRAVSATMTFRLTTALALLGAAPFIALLFPYAREVKLAVFALSASFVAASVNQVVIGVQQRHLKMHAVAIGEVVGRAILLGGLFLAMARGWSLIPIVVFVSVGSVANLLINWAVARRYASFRWNWDPAFWKELLSRSWPVGVSILFNIAYFKGDTFILSLVRPAAEVGVYGAAYRVLEIMITFPFMLAGVMLPLLSHAWAVKDHERLSRLLRQSFQAILIFAAPLAAGLLVVGTPAMVMVSGPGFASAGPILKILGLATALIYVGTVSSHAIVAMNAQRRMLPVYIIVAVATLVGYLLLIPVFGMWAAAWLTVGSEAAIMLASMWITLTATPNGFPSWTAIKILAAATVMALIIWPIRNAWLPIPVLGGAIVYLIALFAFRAISPTTVRTILSSGRGETLIDA